MAVRDIHSFIAGQWVAPDASARWIESAITGEQIARAGQSTLPLDLGLDYAIAKGGPALRAMSFHDRARMLKALATHLNAQKSALYDASFDTGATMADHKFDIDGGIGTTFVMASKGRREMPDARFYLDGAVEQLGRTGNFVGQHICTPKPGVAIHINAFNFPVWGMLEKLAPTILAGMPAIVKPATSTSYVTELAVRMILDAGILPEGALQLICGGTGDLLDRLGPQDVVSFTGSASTAMTLRATPNLVQNSVPFTAEQDSLNGAILGPDALPGTAEFGLFIDEVVQEMTVKAGQKCTSIRRMIVPEALVDPVAVALKEKLAAVTVGDPREASTRMGALVSAAQKADVLRTLAELEQEAPRIIGDPDAFTITGDAAQNGAFVPPIVLQCDAPDHATAVHSREAFGPVSTLMGYRSIAHAAQLANKAQGALVLSAFTQDADVARELVTEAAAFHGRIYFNNAKTAGEATGHGAPLPHMIHGGPGRAGGGEELGGVRAVKHYMQRTAIQANPDLISAIGSKWVPGSDPIEGPAHPFRRRFHALQIGETLVTDKRRVTLEDIETFAHFTGDTFYAHMDQDAAARNPFFPGRVAHGYLLLSFAAGLFVDPDEGPVLANTGLDKLRFMKPVEPDTEIHVRLTVAAKTPRNDDYGEVRWHVSIVDADEDLVAEYELLTMNAY